MKRDKTLEMVVEQLLKHLRLAGDEYKETPRRVSDMLHLCTEGMNKNCKEYMGRLLPYKHKEMIAIKHIEFFSLCPHHLMPYFGEVDVAYIPAGCIVGLSKFHSLVECVASKPQLQEALTSEIANTIDETLHPLGCMVIVEAQHTCMFIRGRYDYSQMSRVHEKTITSALRGIMLSTEGPRMEALKLLGR